mmetsp:Transcript_106376/g.307840  ORF Transcript_106376/g.307840 Transcript_106376/m.307840 type:complete len:200 (-) Transcript_106376:1410-2009(-)
MRDRLLVPAGEGRRWQGQGQEGQPRLRGRRRRADQCRLRRHYDGRHDQGPSWQGEGERLQREVAQGLRIVARTRGVSRPHRRAHLVLPQGAAEGRRRHHGVLARLGRHLEVVPQIVRERRELQGDHAALVDDTRAAARGLRAAAEGFAEGRVVHEHRGGLSYHRRHRVRHRFRREEGAELRRNFRRVGLGHEDGDEGQR